MEELVLDKTLNPEEIVQQIKSRTTVLPSSSSSTVSVTQDDLQSEMATNHQSQEVPSVLARARDVIKTTKFFSMHRCTSLMLKEPMMCELLN